jgi:hypothetical protein
VASSFRSKRDLNSLKEYPRTFLLVHLYHNSLEPSGFFESTRKMDIMFSAK